MRTRAIPTPAEIEARLCRASELADLSSGSRLDAKIDLSPEGVERRLREASDLLDLCRALGPQARAIPPASDE